MDKFVKDAPCLCKDENMADVLIQRNFFQKLHYYWLRRKKAEYAFPVVYEDKTVSRFRCDGVGRKPLGVLYGKMLITLYDSPQKMTWGRAMTYCENIQLLERNATAGEWPFWNAFRSDEQRGAINNLLERLGGNPLREDRWYWTVTGRDELVVTWSFFYSDCDMKCLKYYVRPVIYVVDLLSKSQNP